MDNDVVQIIEGNGIDFIKINKQIEPVSVLQMGINKVVIYEDPHD